MATQEAVRDAIRAKQLPRAMELAGELLQRDGSDTAYALYGDVMGRLGQRADAEDWLAIAAEQHPQSGFIRAVLGEQRVRQANWDQGAKDFIRALSTGDEEAFQHTQRVIRDLAEARAAGKVREEDAMKFVNKLDYNVPAKTEEMTFFFAAARRALSNGTRLENQVETPDPPSRPPPSPAASSPRPPSLPPRSSTPEQRSRAKERRRKESGDPRRLTSSTTEDVPPELLVDGDFSERTQLQSRGTSVAVLMDRDRRRNEQLQNEVGSLGIPGWPSKITEKLDTIPVLRPTLLGYSSASVEQSGMALTSGSVDTEILLERCLQNLLQGVQQGTARPVHFEPEDLTKIEVNAWDGLLDRLPPIPEIYKSDRPEISQSVLALGRFIGGIVVHVYDGTWHFEDEAAASILRVGDRVLRPFEKAGEWVSAGDKDDVDLFAIIREARKYGHEEESRFKGIRIDETRDLEGKALAMKLAELWTHFRSHPDELSLADLAGAVRPIESLDRAILFAIERRWAPKFANFGGRMDEVALAYMRDSGEFLVLASRKHFARLLEEFFHELNAETAPQVVDFFDRFHRPDLDLIRTQTGDDSEYAPTFQASPRGGGSLTLAGRRDGKLNHWTIEHMPGSLRPWRVQKAS